MGGLFQAPKPVVVARPAPPSAAATPAPVPEPATVAADDRAAARLRAAGGRAGTIATSERGVLAPLPGIGRKSLLGE